MARDISTNRFAAQNSGRRSGRSIHIVAVDGFEVKENGHATTARNGEIMHTSFRRVVIICTAWGALFVLAACIVVTAVRMVVDAWGMGLW
jgi:Fe-S cluster assembly scaffold protein SufB